MLLNCLPLLGSLALILLTGYAVICAILGRCRLHPALMVGLSWTAGAGVMPLVIMLLSMGGVVPGRWELLGIAAAVATAISVLNSRGLLIRLEYQDRRLFFVGSRGSKLLTITSVGLIFIAFLSVAAELRVPGLSDVDAFAIWVFKAKIVSTVPLLPVPRWLTDPTLSFSHQDYPLGVPLLTAAVHAATGWPVERCAKMLLLPTFAGLILVIFGGACSLLSRPIALAVTATFVGSPLLIGLAGDPVAEVPLILQHTASVWLLVLWMRGGGRRALLGSAVFAALAAMVKNEGLALLPILAVVALVFAVLRRSKALAIDCVWAAIVSLAILAPWLLYRIGLPRTHEDYGGRLSHLLATVGGGRLSAIAAQFLTQPLRINSAGGGWILLLLCAVLGRRAWRRAEVVAMWLLLLTHVGLYVLVFSVTPWDLDTLLGMVGPKLMLHVFPAAVVLIALHVSSIDGASPAAFPLLPAATTNSA